MSGEAGISTVLAKAAGYGIGPRRIHPSTTEDAVGAVLEAIRNCIAPRILTVLVDGAVRLEAVTAGGCLLRVTAAPPPLGALTGRALGASDIDALAEGLTALFPGGQSLRLAHARPETPPDPLVSGIPADLLVERLGLARFAEAVADPEAYFAEAAEEVLLAILVPGAAPQVLRPDPALNSDLFDTVAALLADPDGPAALPRTGEVLILAGRELTLGLTSRADGPRVLVFEPGTAPELASFWSGIHHALLLVEE